MSARDDSRDMANRIRGMLELVQSVRPDGFGMEQMEQVARLDRAIHEALLAVKAYVHLRNGMN